MPRVALVTGASGTLGGAVARRLAAGGWSVLAAGGRRPVPEGEGITPASCDLRDASCAAELVRRAAVLGPLRALVHCAGAGGRELIPRLSAEEFDEAVSVNLRSAFLLAREVSGVMEGGHILFVSSILGLRGGVGTAAYSAAKGGLIGLGKSLAAELGGRGVAVNVLIPGYFDSAMTAPHPEARRRALEESALGRLGDPEEVAGFVEWLLSSQNVSGQVFALEGRALPA